MKTRKVLEIDANDADLDLFRLASTFGRLAEKHKGHLAAKTFADAEKAIRAIRPGVRGHMHKNDRERTE